MDGERRALVILDTRGGLDRGQREFTHVAFAHGKEEFVHNVHCSSSFQVLVTAARVPSKFHRDSIRAASWLALAGALF